MNVPPLLKDRPENELARVEVLALVVRGEFDPIYRPAWAAQVAAGRLRERLATLPHASHTLVWDAPPIWPRLATHFIGRATERRRRRA